MAGDDIVKIEQQEIERLISLGYGRYAAIQLVDAGMSLTAAPVLVGLEVPLAAPGVLKAA
jgi:hypothetical protein